MLNGLALAVIFNRYKHKKSAWITQGILTSIRYRDKMYKQLKLTNPTSGNYETIKINLKTYNTILKKNIRAAKQVYFESRFSLFRNDIRNTWKTINECLSKNIQTTVSQLILKTMAIKCQTNKTLLMLLITILQI